MVRVKLDSRRLTLTLTHVTDEDYRGVIILPTDPANPYALEEVHSPRGTVIHSTEFFVSTLENHTDLTPYLIGMTRSAQRKDLAHVQTVS